MFVQPKLVKNAARVYNLYFTDTIIQYNRYYLSGNLSLSNRTILDLSIMLTDATDKTGYPATIKYNGINYTNATFGTVGKAFLCLVDKQGNALHTDLPLYILAPNRRQNFTIGGDIDFTKSYIYWTVPPAPTNNVIPIKLDYL
jgi:hypothetical protein